MQGLDYFSADGAQTFDEMEKVVQKLGDEYGKGHTWAKDLTCKLKMAKRRLKRDYSIGYVNAVNIQGFDYGRSYDYRMTCFTRKEN